MFIFDFVAETILDQILDWIYGKIIGFLNDFFVMMNNMGVELFALPWVEAVTTFFSYFGWALFGVGLVVGAFRTHVIQHRGASYCRTVRIGYQHQDQHHEQCVCSPDRHQYDQNGREGSGSIRWCYDRVEIRKSV